MRKSQSKLKSFYNENKTPILVVLGLFLLWKLRGLFSAVGNISDTIATTVSGATAGITSSAQDAKDKVSVKTVAPNATAAQLETWRNDSRSIAAALGHLPGVFANSVISDDISAMSVCKRYSRLLYTVVGGKPVQLKDSKNHNRPMVRAKSLQLPVLYPFYKELTAGRSLLTDLNGEFSKGTLSRYQSFWQTFVRPL